MKKLNIFDNRKRKILCCRPGEGIYPFNADKLLKNKVYHFNKVIEMKPYLTLIELKEFPKIPFDGSQFEEVPTYHRSQKEYVDDYVRTMKRQKKLLYKGKELPNIRCSLFSVILARYKADIEKVVANDAFIIGRRTNDYLNPDLHVSHCDVISRVHAYIVKKGDDFLIYDVSRNGSVIENC